MNDGSIVFAKLTDWVGDFFVSPEDVVLWYLFEFVLFAAFLNLDHEIGGYGDKNDSRNDDDWEDRQISTCNDNPGNLRLTFLLLTIELITGVFIEQSCPAALFIALSLGQFDLGPQSTLGPSDIPVTLFLVTWKKREGCGVAVVEVYLAHGKHARVLGFLTL